ncbi:MAG: T9SS type A sorting domain-containing protein, partial [Bacteroidetes bacterium]|nr:T9SS type A sorting domain-containing protein [Bacteroidota bacterium]
ATGNTWTYTNGTLIFNKSGGYYDVNNGDVFWPTTNGPTNITVLQGGLTFGATNTTNRTVTGIFQTSAGVSINNSSILTITGTCKINAGGFFNQAPTYGNSSTLIYNTGSNFEARQEWYPNNFGSGPGVPQNVTIASGSSVYFNNTNTARLLRGDLNFSAPFAATSTLALSGTDGGDLYIGGNWNKASGGTFAHNGRLVKFNGASNQTITSSGGETFAHLEVNNSNGVTILNDVTVNNTLTLTSGKLGIGANLLTIDGAVAAMSATNSLTGSASSNLTIGGTGAVGTLYFDQTTIGTTNKIAAFTINRTSTGTVTLGNALVVDGTLTLTEGALSGSLSYGANGILTYNGTNYPTTGNVEFPATGGPKDLNVTVANASGISLHANRSLEGNMTIASGQKFIIPSGIGLTVSGTLTNSAGNSGLVIKSGGSLKESTAGVSATVEREIAKDRNWHFLSSPVTTQDICNGRFAPLVANFSADSGATFDFYKWSETTAVTGLPWINLKLATSWGANLTDFGGDPPKFAQKTGYLVAYRSDFPGSATKLFAGTLNADDQTVTLTYGGNGWNLIGNPFPSAVDWDGVTGKTTSLDNGYYYIYNALKSGGAGYEANLTGKISAMQGFFVLAKTSGTGSIGIPNIARTHDNNWLKNTETNPLNQIQLKLATSAYFDEATIVFNENGNISKGWYDACKLFSMNTEVPQVYTLKDNDQQICINSMPFFNKPVTVPVGMIIPADGSYTLQLSGLETFPTLPGILLEDLKTNTTQNLVQTPVYAFSASTTDDPKRFLLHFTGAIGISENSGDHSFQVFSSGNSLYVTDNTGKNQGNVYAYNMMGQLVAHSALNGNSLCRLNMNVPVGYYIVKVISNDQAFSSKVFIHN